LSTSRTSPQLLESTALSAKLKLNEWKKKLGFLKHTKSKMHAASILLYESVVDNLDYPAWFANLSMPDTLYSWYLVSELHVWMLSVRFLADETTREEGLFMRTRLLEFFWEDLDSRLKQLSGVSSGVRKQHMADVFEQFQAALFLYDEGILGDDVRLANAVWRRLFESRLLEDPGQLEAVVAYVRKTVRALDSVPFDELVRNRKFKWLPTPKSLSI
jgi:cytochrome b pre-mRNA-processing protein 3